MCVLPFSLTGLFFFRLKGPECCGRAALNRKSPRSRAVVSVKV